MQVTLERPYKTDLSIYSFHFMVRWKKKLTVFAQGKIFQRSGQGVMAIKTDNYNIGKRQPCCKNIQRVICSKNQDLV